MAKLSATVALDDDPFADDDPPFQVDPPSPAKAPTADLDAATIRRISKSVCLRIVGCADEQAFDAYQTDNGRQQSLDRVAVSRDALSRAYAAARLSLGPDASVQAVSAAIYMMRLEPSCPDEATYNIRQRRQVALFPGKATFQPLAKVSAAYDKLTSVYLEALKENGL